MLLLWWWEVIETREKSLCVEEKKSIWQWGMKTSINWFPNCFAASSFFQGMREGRIPTISLSKPGILRECTVSVLIILIRSINLEDFPGTGNLKFIIFWVISIKCVCMADCLYSYLRPDYSILSVSDCTPVCCFYFNMSYILIWKGFDRNRDRICLLIC